MSKTTRATLALQKAGIAFTLHPYDYDPAAESIGMAAAAALGIAPQVMLKTLMAEADGKPVCVVLPANHDVSMKRLAALFGAKHAQMMKPDAAERLTGYHVGGISPFGQKRAVPTAIEETAMAEERVYINAGQRGLLLALRPEDARQFLRALTGPVMA
ncbi:Cys-tRNA(Pro) deacylase [Roseomonas aerophila]|uniref:Cys-tRNA(Pro)/Cys-tRNA(Cys) deacylase n=1 Tax=Teichococcus aerophilus TaxID=1224513 RepID=A0ABR7RK50_9PROT|nr:Cys-tRNA(Pro) deacylase [Pseudoroseomonas aerophila]MBC9206960.1 Cys-tRNA(Pro) deacylase [Pseudoroseomonas aerophila]